MQLRPVPPVQLMTPADKARTITLTLTLEEARLLSAALSTARLAASATAAALSHYLPSVASRGAVTERADDVRAQWDALRERLHALMSLRR